MLARRFLWVVAGIIVLVLVGALAYRIFERDLMQAYFVPGEEFKPMPGRMRYADRSLWIARPDIPNNPALWTPARALARPPQASVFFIHPTSFLGRDRWNAPVDDKDSQDRAALFVRSQASVFNDISQVWAPRYRQAAFGAFMTTKADAQKALDFAYGDVRAAFGEFLRQAPSDRPIILAGHSQGSAHLMRLLREEVAGKPLARRIAAAYVVGWPISTTADLPHLGLPACRTRTDTGCILSWQSFSEPADPKMVTDVFDASSSPEGTSRAGSPMLCTNPLTGNEGDAAPAGANMGTLIPDADLKGATVLAKAVPARCDARGFLLIGENLPEMGNYVLPGNNYHVYDYPLFWANIRADAGSRVALFLAR